MKIVEAVVTYKPKFELMLDQYLCELKTHRELDVGATDSATYPYLDSYWKEVGRHPFLIHCNAKLVGFSFIRDPQSTESNSSQIAEFYIIPEERGKGIGQKAIFAILELFPGHWELQVHNKNHGAIIFWEKCIKEKAKQDFRVTEIIAADGRRTQYNFEI